MQEKIERLQQKLNSAIKERFTTVKVEKRTMNTSVSSTQYMSPQITRIRKQLNPDRYNDIRISNPFEELRTVRKSIMSHDKSEYDSQIEDISIAGKTVLSHSKSDIFSKPITRFSHLNKKYEKSSTKLSTKLKLYKQQSETQRVSRAAQETILKKIESTSVHSKKMLNRDISTTSGRDKSSKRDRSTDPCKYMNKLIKRFGSSNSKLRDISVSSKTRNTLNAINKSSSKYQTEESSTKESVVIHSVSTTKASKRTKVNISDARANLRDYFKRHKVNYDMKQTNVHRLNKPKLSNNSKHYNRNILSKLKSDFKTEERLTLQKPQRPKLDVCKSTEKGTFESPNKTKRKYSLFSCNFSLFLCGLQ